MRRPGTRLLIAAALALLSGSAIAQSKPARPDLSRPGSSFIPKGKPGTWQSVVTRTPRGHLIGDPEAKARLIAFVSYTCPACADFAARGEAALELAALTQGTISLEIRPRIGGGLDLAVTLLAQCGDPARFKARHRTLMLGQAEWLAKARTAPASQRAIWERGDRAGRQNAASALGLTAMLVRRGESLTALDACLADDAAARELRAAAAADSADFPIDAAPAFALDGKLLPGVHGWEALYPVLSARFAKPAG